MTIETNIGIPVGKVPYAVIEYADQVNFLKENVNQSRISSIVYFIPTTVSRKYILLLIMGMDAQHDY